MRQYCLTLIINIMAYSYKEFTDNDVTNVFSSMRNELNSLTSEEANTVKICTSDQKGGDARSLIVWNGDPASIPGRPKGTVWQYYTWPTYSDYDQMYRDLIDALNNKKLPNGTNLTDSQVYYSKITMTNYQSGDATLSLWYRT